MKLTVCEMKNRPSDLERDWEELVTHVKNSKSDLVLLPEMIFSPWFSVDPKFDPGAWEAAVKTHEEWFVRLPELAPAAVCGSRPVNTGSRRLNQAFIWETDSGLRSVHDKYCLPDEKGFWEKSWYDRGDYEFNPILIKDIKLGFLICSELWFFQHSRSYGKNGVHLVLCPRATPRETLDKWSAGGRAAAVVSGAFCLSSNRFSFTEEKANLGGQGWIIEPDGRVLGRTSQYQPFLTLEIDIREAENAKLTYPRYIPG